MKTLPLAKVALKSLLPFQPALRRSKRRLSPYTDNPANSHFCITQGLQQIEALRAAGVPLDGAILEFGTGWLPLIPKLFHLAGARSLILTDVERLMDISTIARADSILDGRMQEIGAVLGRPEADLRALLRTPFNATYLAPWHAESQPDASVDVILSRAVFEHVPVKSLEAALTQFHRILRPGGAMCHVVDNSDHWEHQDKSLSRIDFLRYDNDLRWKIANFNVQSYQNRLRHSDYTAMFESVGFSVLDSVGEPDPVCLDELRRLPLAKSYRCRSHEDLAILTSLFVLQRKQ